MFQFIPVHEENTYAVRVSGKLTHEDYLDFLPQLESLIKPGEKISLLIELDDFHGADLSAIKDDLNFGISHNKSFEKVAIVGDKKWQKWMTLLASPFISGEIKYYNRVALQEAWDWLRIHKYTDDELAEMPIVPYKKIMACLDFSPHSIHATRRAIDIADKYNAQLLLVNVFDESALYDLYYEPVGIGFSMTEFSQAGIEDVKNLIDSLIDKSKKQMESILNELDLKQDQSIILTGRPNSTLNSYAEAQEVDLIIMGTQGRRGMDAVLGSVTRYVQTHARCEVLSVPLVNY